MASTRTPAAPTDRIRVEELARQASVSVDTIRFYQKRQLLPAPVREGRIAWYTAEHVERLARIRELQREGFSLAMIRRVIAGELDAADEPLAAAVLGAQRGEAEQLDREELAARVGIPPSLLDAVVREGLVVPLRRDDTDRFSAGDADVLRAGLRLLELGFPLPDLLALARRHHEATRAIADDAVELFDEHVRRPLRDEPLTDAERAERLVAAFRTLLPTVTALVSQHFRNTLLEVAQEHLEAVGTADDLAAMASGPDGGRAR
jgi:DNA-binding transcriptional MerR regulator